ncbi:hypothetical protein LTR09_003178 [Extremus antarcticus]|uniref:Histone H1 n=1 Tax=Extremus antarcticus TaxID=702011 RepID=A0AAJ0GEF9_9PEZI|nr:hypothetical protein LTR09_003178 [Extremus antarcticus]
MPPKKAAAATKKTGTASSHPPYQDMIKEAVINLKERNGSSRQAIKKYVQANNNLSGVTDAAFNTQLNRALQKGSETGVFARPKGTSGTVKLAGPKTTETAPVAKKAPAAKKAATTTKAAATKKAPAKKAATKTTAAKKAPAAKKVTATKSKANTSKVRKTPVAAPAVEDKPPVVLGKTKSGRVTKTKQPIAVAKKTAPAKKAAGRKAPAKKATPKKA